MAKEKSDSEVFDLAAPVVVRAADFDNPGLNETGIPRSGPGDPVQQFRRFQGWKTPTSPK